MISYKGFIAGALLKFKKLDSFDISLLIEMFERDSGLQVSQSMGFGDLGNYIGSNDVYIFLATHFFNKSSYPVDLILKKFMEYIPHEVEKFFSSIDKGEYYTYKKRVFKENKKVIIEDANILLISENDADFIALKRYGFKNVDRFKSKILADKYFDEHPDHLDKYHVVLNGEQSCIIGHTAFLNHNTCYKKNIVDATIYASGSNSFLSYEDKPLHRNPRGPLGGIYQTLDELVKAIIINHSLYTHDVKGKKFAPIEEYINPNKIALPSKMKDVKILCCGFDKVDFEPTIISEALGLNVEFLHDNNFTLGRDVQYILGEYDIIIASELFSYNLKSMAVESAEQSKITGRQFNMLVTYKSDDAHEYDISSSSHYTGQRITVYYAFAGELAKDLEKHTDFYRVHSLDYSEWSETAEIGVLEDVIFKYNEQLKAINGIGLEDCNVRSGESFEGEYNEYLDKVKEEKARRLEPITNIDYLKTLISNYFFYHEKKLVGKVEGLYLEDLDSSYKISSYAGNRLLCSVYLSKNDNKRLERTVKVRTLTNKGTFTDLVDITISIDPHNPVEVNEIYLNAITSVIKKVRLNLAPLLKEAKEAYNAQKSNNVEYDNNQKLTKKDKKKK